MRLYSLIFILFFAVLGCAKEEGVCLKSRGNDTEKVIELGSFNKLEVYDKIDIDIYRSSEFKAIIYSGENIIDGIGLKIKNNTLTVQDNNTCHWVRTLKKKPRVELYLDSLEDVLYYGAGNLICKDTIPSNIMYLEAWEGSGDINYLTNSQEIYLKSHTGVSHFDVRGSSNYLFIYNNTYAQFRTGELIANEIHVASLGNGDIKVFASRKLSVNQTGHSIIEYNASVQELNIIEQQNGELIPY
jgi:hypothetical protein